MYVVCWFSKAFSSVTVAVERKKRGRLSNEFLQQHGLLMNTSKCMLSELVSHRIISSSWCLSSIFTFNRKIGPRTLVWAEKELVDKSAYEFAEVGN